MPRANSLFDGLTGKPLDPDAVARRVTALYGGGGLDTLDYHVIGDESRYGLALDARPNSQGPNYLRFGLSLQDDFQGNSTYNAAIRFVMADITRNAGEWVTDLQIGTISQISSELFLPLAPVFRLVRHAACGGPESRRGRAAGTEPAGGVPRTPVRLWTGFRASIWQLGRDPHRRAARTGSFPP